MTLRVLGDIFSASINHGALRRSSSRASRRGRSLAVRAQRIAHSKSRSTRSRPAEKSKLVILFVLLLFSPAPASADDLIAQWLRQNEGAQTDEARQDLNALTDERWNEIFKIGLEQPDAELGARAWTRNADAGSLTLVGSSGRRVRPGDRRCEGQELRAPQTKDADNSPADEGPKRVARRAGAGPCDIFPPPATTSKRRTYRSRSHNANTNADTISPRPIQGSISSVRSCSPWRWFMVRPAMMIEHGPMELKSGSSYAQMEDAVVEPLCRQCGRQGGPLSKPLAP